MYVSISACRETSISLLHAEYSHTGTVKFVEFTMPVIYHVYVINYCILKYVGVCILAMHPCVATSPDVLNIL